MATLTNADFTAYRRALRHDPVGLAERRAASFSKPQLQAVMQALEDGYTSRRILIKAEMDAAAGETLTNGFARALEDVWMKRKAGAI